MANFCPIINDKCCGSECVFLDKENFTCNLASAAKFITDFSNHNGNARLMDFEGKINRINNDISSIQSDVSTIENKITPKK